MNSESLNPSIPFAVVVNDDRTQLNVLSGLLRKAGLEPRTFTDVEAALAESDPGALPALVVTDLYMPGIDGWRFCRLLRSSEYAAFNHVPILVVSATFAGDEAERIAADIGVEAFLPSPVDGKRFVEQVQAILSGKRVRSPLRVLIVEDSKTQSGIFRKAFEDHGYQTDTAFTAREATDAFKKTAYDVAVLDYYLPDGKGDALLDEFRVERPDCVCLMMTTDPGPELALDWMKRGAAAYLHKPFKPEYLIELCVRARRERALLRVQDLLEVRTHELRQSEQKYRTILENIDDGYYEIDLAGNFTFFNDAMCRILGYPREEMTGMKSHQFTDKEHAKKLFKTFNEVYKTGEPAKEFDWQVIRKDRSKRYIEVSVSLRKDSLGNKIGFFGITRDITERNKAEAALRESEEKYRLIAENTGDLIVVTDINLRFTYVSPSILRTHGFTVEEALNLTIDQFMTPGSLQLLLTVFEEEMKLEGTGNAEPGRIRILEVEEYKKDGSTIWLESSISAQRDKENKPIGILVVSREITERKRAEEERKQSIEKIRRALRATVQSISMTVEMKDSYTSGHQQRVADLARAIATEMGLSADQQDFIRTASTIHDLGKIALPTEILSKPTKLTELEFSMIKTHSQSGYDILKDIEFPWPVADVVLQHHERLDGSGYPQGLKGDDILLEARILTIADVVEAIASHRPYRPSLGIDFALEEISRYRGIFYDADAVDACLILFREKGYALVLKNR